MGFNVRKHLIKVQGGRYYLPVAARLVWFREEHPDWGIDTHALEVNVEKGYAVFEASVFNTDGKLIAKGTKMETREGFHDFCEKAETGSIGRALAVCGYGTQFAPDLFEGGNHPVDKPQDVQTHVDQTTGEVTEEAEPLICADCRKPITDGQKKVSLPNYGRQLCPSCQKEAKMTGRPVV